MNILSDMATSSKDSKAKGTKPAELMEEEIITIELQYLLTPIAIVLSAIIISFTIFFSMKKFGGVVSTTSGTDVVADDTTADDTYEEFVEVTTSIDDDPILGDKDTAKIAIVEFSDFECPYCQSFFLETHAAIIENYVDTGDAIFVYRDLPLSFHPSAEPAALAANCVRDQKGDSGYYEFHDALFTEGLTEEGQLAPIAKDIGVNMDEFTACVDSEKFADEIAGDLDDAADAGISGTPGFVVGVLNDDGTVDGVKISGAYPYASFEQIIEEQLDRV